MFQEPAGDLQRADGPYGPKPRPASGRQRGLRPSGRRAAFLGAPGRGIDPKELPESPSDHITQNQGVMDPVLSRVMETPGTQKTKGDMAKTYVLVVGNNPFGKGILRVRIIPLGFFGGAGSTVGSSTEEK